MYSCFKDLGMKGLLSDNSDDESDCDGPNDCKFGPSRMEAGHKTMLWRHKLDKTRLARANSQLKLSKQKT